MCRASASGKMILVIVPEKKYLNNKGVNECPNCLDNGIIPDFRNFRDKMFSRVKKHDKM